MAALLAFCIAAAACPPVGLAAGGTVLTVPVGTDLISYIESSAVVDGATLVLEGDITADGKSPENPWIIKKNITIDGSGHRLYVNGTGILLGADVTLQNVDLHLKSTDSRNAIIANGYALTLDNVTAGTGARSINVFGGTLLKASYEKFDVPGPGNTPTITITGKTKLQNGNSSDTLGSANIFAGSLSMGDFSGNLGEEGDGADSMFSGNVTINIVDSAETGALGTIYAGGGQQRRPSGWSQGKVTIPDPEKYRVDGTVTINGTKALPNVDGAGASTTNVVYNASPNTTPEIALENISSFRMEQGKLVLGRATSFQNENSLSVLSGAELDISKYTGGIGDFTGGGSLVLG